VGTFASDNRAQGLGLQTTNRWLRELLDRIAASRARHREDSRVSAARTRFWSDFRAGQREADTPSSRSDR
jgi:hypothetical protein